MRKLIRFNLVEKGVKNEGWNLFISLVILFITCSIASAVNVNITYPPDGMNFFPEQTIGLEVTYTDVTVTGTYTEYVYVNDNLQSTSSFTLIAGATTRTSCTGCIDLYEGENVIKVILKNSDGNTVGSDMVTVYYTPPEPIPEFPTIVLFVLPLLLVLLLMQGRR